MLQSNNSQDTSQQDSIINDLQQQLLQREHDCRLAATLGQQLLDERTTLLERISQLEASIEQPKKITQLDPMLQAGIEKALVTQIRDLQFKIHEEATKNIQLSQQKSDSETALERLKKQFVHLERKHAKIAERAWNLEVEATQIKQSSETVEAECQRLRSEASKLQGTVKIQRETIEALNAREKELLDELDAVNAKNAFEMRRSKRALSGLRREYADLQKLVSSQPRQSRQTELDPVVHQQEQSKDVSEAQVQTDATEATDATYLVTQLERMKQQRDELQEILSNTQDKLEQINRNSPSATSIHSRRFSNASSLKLDRSDSIKQVQKPLLTLQDDLLKGMMKSVCIQTDNVASVEQGIQVCVDQMVAGMFYCESPMSLSDIASESEPNIIDSNPFEVEDDLDVTSFFSETTNSLDLSNTSSNLRPFTAWNETEAPETIDKIEALTHTMIGSYFQKYNRFGKHPQLRFFWINPNTRTLHWSNQHPSQESTEPRTNRSAPAPIRTRSCFLVSVSWAPPPSQKIKNFPPSRCNRIVFTTPRRDIEVVPLTWDDHDKWVAGVSLLLQRGEPNVPLHQEMLMQHMRHKSTISTAPSLNGSPTRPNAFQGEAEEPRLRRRTVSAFDKGGIESIPVTVFDKTPQRKSSVESIDEAKTPTMRARVDVTPKTFFSKRLMSSLTQSSSGDYGSPLKRRLSLFKIPEEECE